MTYSLAGRCLRTGMVGAVVTTSAIAVGSRCAFARAGVGAALTQHRTDPRLGPRLLDQLSYGATAEQALATVVAGASNPEWRQLAVIDAKGRTAAFSGDRVRDHKAHAQGTDCVAIANIVRSPEVPAAMTRAFEDSMESPLPDRLLAALVAGAAAGGELQPVTSAGMIAAWRESFPYVDLRVDLHDDPIAELHRLWRAYSPEADAYVMRAIDAARAVPPAAIGASPAR